MARAVKNLSDTMELERVMGRMVRQGLDADAIIRRLQGPGFELSDELQSPTALVAVVQDYLSRYKDYPLIQTIMNNIILRPNNRSKWFVFDSVNIEEHTIDGREHLQTLLDSETVQSRIKSCAVIYNPNSGQILDESKPTATYNSYRPPEWKYNHFFGKETLPVLEQPPELFMRFVRHLCDNDDASVEFLLDWIAISLQSRNLTYLCTIGAQGIGKGILGGIIARLHGKKNAVKINFNSITKQFNALLADKTFIYLNEVNKVNSSQYDILKSLNDDEMEVERKFEESESNMNYANIYLSSNNLDSLPTDIGDRRMSIIMLTKTRFEHTNFTKAEITALVSDEKLLTQIAQYLFYRKYNPENISFPHKSKRALEMMDASILDWQRSFLDEVCKKYAGKAIKAADAVSLINHFAGRTRPANISSLIALSRKLPGIFEAKKMGEYQILEYPLPSTITSAVWVPGPKTRVQCIQILPLAEQKSYDVNSDDDNVADYA